MHYYNFYCRSPTRHARVYTQLRLPAFTSEQGITIYTSGSNPRSAREGMVGVRPLPVGGVNLCLRATV